MANHQISSTFQGGVIIAEFINMKTLVYNIYFLVGVFPLKILLLSHNPATRKTKNGTGSHL
jgi:hypothetical protein